MKVAHRNKELLAADGDWIQIAKAHELEGELARAASAYEKSLQKKPVNEPVYNRLMLLYRKLREYKKELAIIKKGISTFETLYNKTSKTHGKKVASLSIALAKSTGLVDKKGVKMYEPEPLARWRKRKLIVEKKIGL